MFAVLLVVDAIGCGRLNYDDVDRAFGQPQLIAGITVGADEELGNPTLTADELEIYLSRADAGFVGNQIHRATRSDRSRPFSELLPVAELNSASAVVSTPEISADGLTIYLSAKDTMAEDLWRSERATRSSPWQPPSRVEELSTEAAEECATIDASGTSLAFHRDTELYLARRTSRDHPWSAPERIAELSNVGQNTSPYLSPDGLTIWFERTIDGNFETLVRAGRNTLTDLFSTVVRLEGVNSEGDNSDPWLSNDRERIYFSSSRSGRFRLYVASR